MLFKIVLCLNILKISYLLKKFFFFLKLVGFNNNNVIKPVKRNETILVSQSLMQNKRNDTNVNNNYQTITKNSAHKMLNFTGNSANMINNKSSLNSHSRSTTP